MDPLGITFRICHPYDINMFVTLNPITNRFDGYDGKFFTSVINYFVGYNEGYNVTIRIDSTHKKDQLLDLNDFTECLKRLANNQSDMYLYIVDYPYNFDGIQQGDIVIEFRPVIFSAYTALGIHYDAQVLGYFGSFEWDTWLLVLAWLLLVYGLLRLRTHFIQKFMSQIKNKPMKSKNHHFLYKLLTHATRIGNMNDSTIFDRLLFTFSSLFAFLVVQFFLTWISTDLVVVKEPELFRTYDDVIERNASALFLQGFGMDQAFRNSPIGSKEKTIWDESFNRMGNRVIFSVDKLNETTEIIDEKGVMIVNDMTAPVVLSNWCKGRLLYVAPDSRQIDVQKKFYLLSMDPSAKPLNKGFVFSPHLNGRFARVVRKRITNFLEIGLFKYFLKHIQAIDMGKQLSLQQERGPERFINNQKDCISNKIVKWEDAGPEQFYDRVKLKNCRTLLFACGSIIFVSFLLLFSENYSSLRP